MRRTRAAALAAVLAGCGGGAEDPPSAGPVAYDVAAPVRAWMLSARSTTLTGTLGGRALTLVVQQEPLGRAAWDGQESLRVLRSVTLLEGATVVDQGAGVVHLHTVAAQELGTEYADGRVGVTSMSALPQRVSAGQAGALGNTTIYATAERRQVVEQENIDWTMPQAGKFCLRTSDTSGARELNCYLLQGGAVAGLEVTLEEAGQSVTYR